QLGLTKETRAAFTSEPALSHHWARWFNTNKLLNKGFAFERLVDTDGVSVCVHYTRPLPPPPAPPPAASSSSSPSAAAAAAHAVGLPHIGKGIAETREYVFDPDTQIGVGIDPGITQAVSAASGVWDPQSGQLTADQLRRWKLTKGQVKHASGLNNARRDTERWLAQIKPHLQHLAAASSAGTSLEANLKHITVTQATWDAVWEVYLDPKWARQRLRLYGAQDRALEQFFNKLEEDMAEVSMKRNGHAKQLVVFFGAATIGTGGGWGADAVLRACCKVVCRPRGAGQRRGRVVLVDEHRISPVSSAVNGQQPCEEELDKLSATKPAGWKPPAGLMWCPVVAPRKPPQAPRSSQAATQPAASEPGPSTPPPAKRSKPAAEPTKGKGKGKAAKAKPAPQPGRWLDRDCNAALNMQRIGESRWRPLELCYWPEQGALPAKGKEYPGLGYKRLRDKPPKAQQEQQQQPAEAQAPRKGPAKKSKGATSTSTSTSAPCNHPSLLSLPSQRLARLKESNDRIGGKGVRRSGARCGIGRKSSGVVVTGGEDRMVNLWTIGAQTRTLSLAGHQTPVEAVCFDLNEEIVAAGAASGSIKLFDLDQAKGEQANRQTLWDLRRKDSVMTCKGHRSGVLHVRFSPDGRMAASGSEDGEVKIFDITAGKIIQEFSHHTHQITGLDFHPQEYLMATCSADKTVKIWDLDRWQLLESTPPETTAIRATAFHPDGNLLFSALADGLRVWQFENGPITQLDSVDVPWAKVSDMTMMRDRDKLVGCSFHNSFLGMWVVDLKEVRPFCQQNHSPHNGKAAARGGRPPPPYTAAPFPDSPQALRGKDLGLPSAQPIKAGGPEKASFNTLVYESGPGPNLQDYALRRQGQGSAAAMGGKAAALQSDSSLHRGDEWSGGLVEAGADDAGPALGRQHLLRQPNNGGDAVGAAMQQLQLGDVKRSANRQASQPTAEVSDVGCWPQPALRSSSRTDLQPGSSGATDMATSGSGPLLPAGSGLGPLAANRPLPSTSYLTQRNGAAPCLEPVKPGNAGQGTAEGLRVPRRGAEAARPSMVSVGVGVGDSLMRRDVQPSQLQKLAQMASEQPGQSPAAVPGRGFLAGPVPVQGPSSSRDAPEPPRANRYSQGSSRTDCQLLPSSQVSQPQLSQQQEGYGSAGGPWHARGIQGGGGPAPCARTDMELMDDITRDCDTMQRLLRARASGTQAMRAFLQRGDLRGALGAARRQSEPSIAADVLAALASRPGFGNMLMLEHVPDLVPVLEAILGLPGDPHVQVALDLGLVVCKCFGATIKDVCAAVPARGGVDMAFEQRQAKCETARMVLQGLKAKVAWCLHQRDPGSLVAQKAAQLIEQLMNVC
ncbi:hypothetical protein QJQ45_025493, partial [Haematococcus lacustris]